MDYYVINDYQDIEMYFDYCKAVINLSSKYQSQMAYVKQNMRNNSSV